MRAERLPDAERQNYMREHVWPALKDIPLVMDAVSALMGKLWEMGGFEELGAGGTDVIN